MGIVRVDVQAGRGQDRVEADRAAKAIANSATAANAVDVQLEGRTILLALQHVLDQTVRHRSVLVGHVHRCGAGAIAETADVAAERHVLTRSLTNGRNVDFGACDLKAPVAALADDGILGVGNLELVRRNSSAVVSNSDCGAACGSGHLQHAGSSGVADHVVRGGGSDASRKGAATGAACVGVDDTEHHRVADLEVQVRGYGDFVVSDGNAAFAEGAGGAGGLVVEGAGRAGQNGGGHRAYQMNVVGAGTARLNTG